MFFNPIKNSSFIVFVLEYLQSKNTIVNKQQWATDRQLGISTEYLSKWTKIKWNIIPCLILTGKNV